MGNIHTKHTNHKVARESAESQAGNSRERERTSQRVQPVEAAAYEMLIEKKLYE